MTTFAARSLGAMRATLQWLSSRWLAIVGWSELVGGAAGSVLFVMDARSAESPAVPWWSLAGALAFGAASCLAGLLLLRRRPGGRALSIAVQSLQVFRVAVAGVAWRATAGLALTLWYSEPGGWDGIFGATATFRVAHPSPSDWEFGMNVFALLALYKLLRGTR